MNFKELFENEFYEVIYKNKDLVEEVDSIYLIKSLFYLGKCEQGISIIQKLEKNIINTYYEALFHMQNKDLLKAYKILDQEILIEPYKDKEGANYINLLKEKTEYQLLVIIYLFLKNNLKLIIENNICDLIVNYFDLLSSIYELGYSKEVIEELTIAFDIIFKE